MARTKSKATTKAAEPEEVEDDEEDLELEELEDDEAEETQPKGKTKKGGATEEVAFGASDLAALLTKKTGKAITARDLRTQLRRMARDGRINREVIAGNKSRYSWSGPDDPEVKKIIKAVTGGELEEAKKEKLAELKANKAKKDAAKKKAKAKAEKAKAAEAEDDEDDDE